MEINFLIFLFQVLFTGALGAFQFSHYVKFSKFERDVLSRFPCNLGGDFHSLVFRAYIDVCASFI